jgi:hypothetical protein
MMWFFSGVVSFLVLVGIYLRYKARFPGPTDRRDLQSAYWRATNRLGLFALILFVAYLVALVLSR